MIDSEDQSLDTDAEPTDAVGKPPDIMDTLMENATEEFGWAPRDVYYGVFDLPFIRREHNAAVAQVDYSQLAAFAIQFSKELHLTPLSHKLIAVNPIASKSKNNDSWTIEFKSAWVRGKIMDSARSKEDAYFWNVYNSLRKVGGASALAGHLFEEIVHRIFAHGWNDAVLKSQPTPMVSDGNDPPTFSADPSSTPALGSLLPPLSTGAMDTVVVDFKLKDLNVTVDDGKYYTSSAGNHALFNSFTIGRDLSGAVLISVFQITISTTHGGSTEGYEHIRKIMGCVKSLLKAREPGTEIKVAYFLVCPESERRQWNMPIGWNKVVQNNHRREAYCVRVCVPGMSYSLPIL